MNAKEEIVNKTPLGTNYRILPYIYEAMELYAKQKAWEAYKESERSYATAVKRPVSNEEELKQEFYDWWEANNK